MKSALAILLLALSAPCWAQSDYIQSDLIQAPDQVPVGSTIVVQIKGDLPYTIEPKPIGLIRLKDDDGNRVLLIQGAASPGYEISVDYQVIHPTEEETKSAPWDDREAFKKWLREKSRDEFFQDSHTVKVGKQPDPGPDPEPEPDPPGPDPPSPAPIPEPGFRVLIFYEKDDTLPSLQQAILAGQEVADYLDKVCIEEPGGTAGYRIYDDDADLSNELPVWQKAFQRRPQSLPWCIISNGKTGYEGKLPESPSAFIELCKKHEK